MGGSLLGGISLGGKGGGGGGFAKFGGVWGGISSTPTVEQTLIPGANKRSHVLKQNCMKGLNKE